MTKAKDKRKTQDVAMVVRMSNVGYTYMEMSIRMNKTIDEVKELVKRAEALRLI